LELILIIWVNLDLHYDGNISGWEQPDYQGDLIWQENTNVDWEATNAQNNPDADDSESSESE
jgi:hypothetical protein